MGEESFIYIPMQQIWHGRALRHRKTVPNLWNYA